VTAFSENDSTAPFKANSKAATLSGFADINLDFAASLDQAFTGTFAAPTATTPYPGTLAGTNNGSVNSVAFTPQSRWITTSWPRATVSSSKPISGTRFRRRPHRRPQGKSLWVTMQRALHCARAVCNPNSIWVICGNAEFNPIWADCFSIRGPEGEPWKGFTAARWRTDAIKF